VIVQSDIQSLHGLLLLPVIGLIRRTTNTLVVAEEQQAFIPI